MRTVAEICSTGVNVTLSDVPEVLLTATNSEPQVQDAGLAAMAGTHSNGIGHLSDAVFLCGFLAARLHRSIALFSRAEAPARRESPARPPLSFEVTSDSCATG